MVQPFTVLNASLLAVWDLDYYLGKETYNYFVSYFTDFQFSQTPVLEKDCVK